MGVGDLSLTPILNFKGERLQARTRSPFTATIEESARNRSNHKPLVCIIYILNIVYMKTGTGACLQTSPVPS